MIKSNNIYESIFKQGLELLMQDNAFKKLDPLRYQDAAQEVFYELMTHLTQPQENIESYIAPAMFIEEEKDKYEGFIETNEYYSKVYSSLEKVVPELVIVVPAKNESNRIYSSIVALLREIEKSKYNVHLLVLVNNSTDTTFSIVKEVFSNIRLNNLHSELIEYKNDANTSLPNMLNHGYKSFINKYSLNEKDFDNHYFCTFDGDAIVLNAKPHSIIDRQIESFTLDSNLKAISGHSVDLRRNYTHFHNYSNLTSRPEVAANLNPKPYTHGGGGGLFIRMSLYPKNLLGDNDLGGLSLNILAHLNQNPSDLKSIPHTHWITRTDPKIQTSHPTRTNFLDWVVTYKGYKLFRERTQQIIDKDVFEIWEQKRQQSKDQQYELMYSMTHSYFTLKELAGYLLIKKYVYDVMLASEELQRDLLLNSSPRAHKNI